ncbi:MAG: hypothetical protein ACLF0G_14735 [Candidatus Brocadiia bacterium]
MDTARSSRAIVLAALLAASVASGQAERQALLHVSRGQVPTDTGSDGATKLSLEEKPELGGMALRVVYAPGDSFGDSVARVRNWKEFARLEFQALNPADEPVRLTLTVKHRRTTSYQTRVDHPIVLQPGKNAVTVGIDELVNVNGSLPDLAHVRRWYIACQQGQRPTVYFGDIWLAGRETPAAGASAGGPARAYRVTGRIGDQEVDLTVTPLEAPAPANDAAAQQPPATDPRRLARIRAAAMPPIAEPVMFHTPKADAILAALEVFPPDNPWNEVIDQRPLHPHSEAIIAAIGPDKSLQYNLDMCFILVPPDQPRVEVIYPQGAYVSESDKGPFPIPDKAPIEGWPLWPKGADLETMQREGRGDRHVLVVDPVNRMLYELFHAYRTDAGWTAMQSSVFDLKSNDLRPAGWTSADAAGLPIFPAVVRYDECERGVVEHAMRFTVRRTRRAYVYPATHFASRHTDEDLPRMGERFRLRADFPIEGFSPHAAAILRGLKKYGMFVADNGGDWRMSVAPDPRLEGLDELRRVKGRDFEVIVPTGPFQGRRARHRKPE